MTESRGTTSFAGALIGRSEPYETHADLLILGGGSAGFAAAITGARLGASVLMCEGGTLGGTCVNVGCVPSKTLMRAAEAYHRRSHHGYRGLPVDTGPPEWPELRTQKDELVEALRQAKYRDVVRSHRAIELIEQEASLTSARSVRLADGRTCTGERVIIATGASSWIPPIPGLADVGYLDHATAMALPQLPASMVVLGGGSAGLELGQMFARLGVRVTVLEAGPRLLPAEEPAVGEGLAGYLRAEGLDIRTGVGVSRVARGPRGLRVELADGRGVAQADQLLLATGRRARTGNLGLERLGVTLGSRGEIAVGEYLETSVPGVYAAGDVIGDPMFVYAAAYAGALAAENALRGHVRPYDIGSLPRVTFTDPAVACVGPAEQACRGLGVHPIRASLEMRHVPRAIVTHDTRGSVTLLADPRTRKVLGAHILASGAEDMITEVTMALRYGLTVEEIAGTFHPYLTWSEALKMTAQAFDRDVVTLSCCAP